MNKVKDKKKFIEEQYNLTAEMYDERYRDIQLEKYHLMLSDISLSGKILDLGCGTGFLQEYLEKKKIIGVDISFEMLKLAKKRKEKSIQADLDFLPFKDNSFDLILSFTALQNLPDVKKALAEIARIIKPNKTVAVTILEKSVTTEMMTEIEQHFDIQEIRVCGEDIGFVMIKK